MEPRHISLRDLTAETVPLIVNYWFHAPAGFVESMGVDPAKLPQEAEMAERLIAACAKNQAQPKSKIQTLIIFYEGVPVGFHTVNPIVEGDFGIFHAHLCKPEFRGRGLGRITYLLAAKIFMERFAFKKLVYKTPIQNIGAVRLKEKLGIRCLGEEVIDFGIIKAGTIARVFELTCDEAKEMFTTTGLKIKAVNAAEWALE